VRDDRLLALFTKVLADDACHHSSACGSFNRCDTEGSWYMRHTAQLHARLNQGGHFDIAQMVDTVERLDS